jgi:hypothetical protein
LPDSETAPAAGGAVVGGAVVGGAVVGGAVVGGAVVGGAVVGGAEPDGTRSHLPRLFAEKKSPQVPVSTPFDWRVN